jgi:hypothetical protein
MIRLNEVKKNLRPGYVYHRSDLAQWSSAVDRHLRQLLEEGFLTKLSGGLYYCPRKTTFGMAPPEDKTLVEAFLKDRRFLLTSPNVYNALGVGTTQLYNITVVYNHKRHGRFKLGGRVFDFRKKPDFPSKLTSEFLLVDLMNNLKRLAEDHDRVRDQVEKKAATMDGRALSKAVQKYGGVAAKKLFARVLTHDESNHAIH